MQFWKTIDVAIVHWLLPPAKLFSIEKLCKIVLLGFAIYCIKIQQLKHLSIAKMLEHISKDWKKCQIA